MESSRFHLMNRRSPTRFVFEDRELFRRVSHLLLTKLAGQCRTKYGTSPAEGRRSGEHSVVECVQCRSQRREGSKPNSLSVDFSTSSAEITHPHGCVKSSGNLIILLQSWTAPKDFR